MIHAMITLIISACFYPIGFHAEVSVIISAFYVGREHAQAEYRTIYTNYGRKRANAPWWCGFEPRAWNWKSLLDWMVPVVVAIVAAFI